MKTIITSLLVCIVASAITAFGVVLLMEEKTDNDKLTDYYETQVATNISAHGLRKKLSEVNKTFYLVDVRSKEEYLEWHIIGAINIPAYTNRENTQNISNEEILKAFRGLDQSKDIITYCYSAYCMTSRKIGKYLAENWVYAKHLTVWWNEWRYGWSLWNYPHEEDKTDKYITSGETPGTLTGSTVEGACWVNSDFGC